MQAGGEALRQRDATQIGPIEGNCLELTLAKAGAGEVMSVEVAPGVAFGLTAVPGAKDAGIDVGEID